MLCGMRMSRKHYSVQFVLCCIMNRNWMGSEVVNYKTTEKMFRQNSRFPAIFLLVYFSKHKKAKSFTISEANFNKKIPKLKKIFPQISTRIFIHAEQKGKNDEWKKRNHSLNRIKRLWKPIEFLQWNFFQKVFTFFPQFNIALEKSRRKKIILKSSRITSCREI